MGFQMSAPLFAGARLGVFQALGGETLSSDELAKRLNASPRGIRALCDALTALDLLEKDGGSYRNSDIALRTLLEDAPDSRLALVMHGAMLYDRWASLADAAVRGGSVLDGEPGSGANRDEEAFAKAMADIGRMSAEEVAEKIGLAGVRRMIDVGGGPGVYAIAFARREPSLHAVVFDSPGTLEVARRNIAAAGLEDRVSTQPGDALNDEFGSGYDLIFLSNFVHMFSAEQNAAIIARCARALNIGGRVCVKDFAIDESRTAPLRSALFTINMLVNTQGGDCYTCGEIVAWFEAAGLAFDSETPVCGNSMLVFGKKA